MKVSIIVPVYNVSEWIEDCLLSVVKQTYPSIECIIINDCSPDDSIDKATRFIKDNKSSNIEFKIIHHNKNVGLAAARNTGIRYASGDYLFFLDSDDEICPDTIKGMMGRALEDDSDFVVGDFSVIGENTQLSSSVSQKLLTVKEKRLGTNERISHSFFRNEWYVMAWNKLIKRSFLEKYNLYFPEGLLHEDQLWSLKLAGCACTMSTYPFVTYVYKLRGNSISGYLKERNVEDLLAIFKLSNSFVLQHPDNKYLKGKLRAMAFFICRKIGTASITESAKRGAILKIRRTILKENLYLFPLSMSDLLKTTILLCPHRIMIWILRLYKK